MNILEEAKVDVDAQIAEVKSAVAEGKALVKDCKTDAELEIIEQKFAEIELLFKKFNKCWEEFIVKIEANPEEAEAMFDECVCDIL